MRRAVIVVTLCMISLLSGCSILGAAETTVALRKMDRLDSYRMDMVINMEGTEEIKSYTYVVGEFQQIHVLGTQIELFIKDDGNYVIDDEIGIPILVYSEEYSLDEESYDDFAFFKDLTFEQEGEYWVLDGDEEVFEDFTSIKFLLSEGYVKEMILTGEMEGNDTVISIIYSKYNDVNIEVPYYTPEDEVDDFLADKEELGIRSIHFYDDTFSLSTETLVVDCVGSSEHTCFFETDFALSYNWIDDSYKTDEATYKSFKEFEKAHSNSGITKDFIDFINDYIELVGIS